MENVGKDVVVLPSLTRITIEECVPAAVGVPLKRPVVVLNDAQAGLFVIENPSVSPFASLAVGWKLYAVPTVAVRLGVPLIVGAVFVVVDVHAATANAGSETLVVPSDTLMT